LEIKYFVLAVVAYLVGQVFWILDKYKIWCHPYAIMNGHGFWHILTGCAAVSIFLYFKSEKSI
jgi:predicted membrane channel-forming protein YqfA (hemolysin III family)